MMSRRRSALTVAVLVGFVSLSSSFISAAGGQALKPIRSLTVFDTNGERVGKVISLSSFDVQLLGSVASAVLAFDMDGDVFALQVSRQRLVGFPGSPSTAVFFTSTDCSGSPFVLASPGDLFSRTVVAHPDNTVYQANLHDTVQVFAYHSKLPAATELNPPDPCIQESGSVQAVLALPLIDLDTVFSPPFSVR